MADQTSSKSAGHIRRARESATSKEGAEAKESETSQYLRFGAMIFSSTVLMYLLTYTNVSSTDHIFWSEERLYMSLLMGSGMAIVMLSFMWGMHRNVRVNAGIIAGAFVLGATALWLSRSQYFVDDRAYMQGMIPHHSIAILTSEHADIDDVRVRELADSIIETQIREINEMKWLLNDIDEHGVASTENEASQRPVPEFDVRE